MEDLNDVRFAAGQLIIAGFDGVALPGMVSEALRAGQIGGVVLFRRNIESLESLVEMTSEVHRVAADSGIAPWVCVDQEGGAVRRLIREQGATHIPAMRRVGEAASSELAAQLGEVIATELQAVGFNVNFAPVLDVDTNPDNPVIATRSFGRDPGLVARLAGSLMVGHLIAGVVPCGKHFPGHGDTHVDSHHALPVVAHTLERLEAVELEPFRRLIRAGLPMVMTAHLLVPALDAARPATLSVRVLSGLLRETLGFEGVIVSDDLEMAAVAERFSVEEIMTLGLRAGVDQFLICRDPARWQAAYQHLLAMAAESDEDHARIITAARRVVDLKQRMLPAETWQPSPSWSQIVGCDAHLAVVEAIEAAAQAETSSNS